MNLSELDLHVGPRSLKHLERLSNCRNSIKDLPDDSLEFLVDFADSILELCEKLKYADRGDYNAQLTECTMEKLEILKPMKSKKIKLSDMSPNEFYRSECGKQYLAIQERWCEEPLLTEAQVIAKVAEGYVKKNGDVGIDPNTLARAWKASKKLPFIRMSAGMSPFIRETEQMQYLAEGIAKQAKTNSQYGVAEVAVELPKSIRQLLKDDIKKPFNITTKKPVGILKGPDQFKYDSDEENDEVVLDCHAYVAHVFSNCVLIDGNIATHEDWERVMPPIKILIGKQILAILKRCSPNEVYE